MGSRGTPAPGARSPSGSRGGTNGAWAPTCRRASSGAAVSVSLLGSRSLGKGSSGCRDLDGLLPEDRFASKAVAKGLVNPPDCSAGKTPLHVSCQ